MNDGINPKIRNITIIASDLVNIEMQKYPKPNTKFIVGIKALNGISKLIYTLSDNELSDANIMPFIISMHVVSNIIKANIPAKNKNRFRPHTIKYSYNLYSLSGVNLPTANIDNGSSITV